MKEFTTDNIRNFCLTGQRGCGKTSLADAIAFHAGANNRVGRVDDGSSYFDYTDAEISRKSSISTKLLAATWKNRKFNLLDCPGHADFVGELLSGVAVSDAVGMLIDAVSGVEVGTQLQWRMMPAGLARFFFINKMDKENVNWQNAVKSIQAAFGNRAVPVQMPIGQADSFKGLIDLVHMKAYTYSGGKPVEAEIPADLKSEAESLRNSLVEMAAESDDSLLEKFFEEGTLDAAQTIQGLRTGIFKGSLFPILFGSYSKDIGASALLDFVTEFLPGPHEAKAPSAVTTGADQAVETRIDPAGPLMAYICKTVTEGHLGEMTWFKVYSGTLRSGVELYNQQTTSHGASRSTLHLAREKSN